jgi:class 3 adenylate cyclase
MDIVVWLRSLGLGKYEAAFRENEIDETVLPSLTHETLKELGVASVGHRVKLLNAIAAHRNDASSKAPSVETATTSSTSSAHPEDRAERHQVTVMFSDFVGSTALSAAWTPKACARSFSAYQKSVGETVRHFEASLRSTWAMGPGVFRLSPSPRGRRRAGRARGAGDNLYRTRRRTCRRSPVKHHAAVAEVTGVVLVVIMAAYFRHGHDQPQVR